MKIGRNDFCPCGSGKKYKKCCLNKEEDTVRDFSKGRKFQLKGEKAEKIIYSLAQKSFLTDWCYLNPKFPDGKELCDLLIVFGEIAIIWQIKDLKKGKDGEYNKREVEKNLRQLSGAKRRLFDLKDKLVLHNPRRDKEEFDPTKINQVYLISDLVGEGQNYFEFIKKVNQNIIHVFDKKGTEIILNELDTIRDFINYLKEKESLLKGNFKLTLMGGEEELLAYYLMNERNFEKFKKSSYILIQEGAWKELQKKPEYLAKKKEDKISYFWDFLIDRAHLSKDKNYEKVAREMARLNRFERREKSKLFFEAQAKANTQGKIPFYRRTIPGDGITYCFFYARTKDRTIRQDRLKEICFATRSYFKQNQKVLGIATEMNFLPEHSFEFCLANFPQWTEKEQKIADDIIKKLGIFQNQEFSRFEDEEYPQQPT